MKFSKTEVALVAGIALGNGIAGVALNSLWLSIAGCIWLACAGLMAYRIERN